MDLTAEALDEFAADTRKGPPKCWLCNLPERPIIEEGRKKGIRVKVLMAFLAQKYGTEATYNRVSHHLVNHVSR